MGSWGTHFWYGGFLWSDTSSVQIWSKSVHGKVTFQKIRENAQWLENFLGYPQVPLGYPESHAKIQPSSSKGMGTGDGHIFVTNLGNPDPIAFL